MSNKVEDVFSGVAEEFALCRALQRWMLATRPSELKVLEFRLRGVLSEWMERASHGHSADKVIADGGSAVSDDTAGLTLPSSGGDIRKR